MRDPLAKNSTVAGPRLQNGSIIPTKGARNRQPSHYFCPTLGTALPTLILLHSRAWNNPLIQAVGAGKRLREHSRTTVPPGTSRRRYPPIAGCPPTQT